MGGRKSGGEGERGQAGWCLLGSWGFWEWKVDRRRTVRTEEALADKLVDQWCGIITLAAGLARWRYLQVMSN